MNRLRVLDGYNLMHVLRSIFSSRTRDATEFDRATIAAVERAGADLTSPRETRHYLYFTTQAEAKRAADELARPFRMVDVRRARKGQDWLVEAVQNVVVNMDTISSLRQEFEAVTKREGGRYDGWEAAIHERAPVGR